MVSAILYSQNQATNIPRAVSGLMQESGVLEGRRGLCWDLHCVVWRASGCHFREQSSGPGRGSNANAKAIFDLRVTTFKGPTDHEAVMQVEEQTSIQTGVVEVSYVEVWKQFRSPNSRSFFSLVVGYVLCPRWGLLLNLGGEFHDRKILTS